VPGIAGLISSLIPWPWTRRRVRMAFPCPACFHPLLAVVEPDLDLECPVCRTTFRVPAPPAPVPRKVVPPPMPVVDAQQQDGLLGTFIFGLGVFTIVVSAAVTMGLGLIPMGLIFFIGTVVARIKNGWRRRNNPAVSKLSRGRIWWEGVKAIGITMAGTFVLSITMLFGGYLLSLIPLLYW